MSASVGCVTDPDIATLRTVLDPAELAENLCRSLHLTGVKELQVRLLRHHPGKRCVFEIALQTNHVSHSLIGKVYAKDRSDVCTLMEDISRAGFGPCEAFSIPQPVAYLRDLQLLLQEKVQGQPATESFLSASASERERAAERCARWLAKFHTIASPIGPSFELCTYLNSIEQWFQRLASLGEPFADKATTLFKRLETMASALDETDMCSVHGDFSHHQVIFRQNSTLTVDWDNYGLADPARDLARFMVGLKRLALRSLGSIQALDHAAGVFLHTYAAQRGWDRTTQLAFHKAAACFEHAKHDVHKQASGWRERAETTLNEGLRILNDGA